MAQAVQWLRIKREGHVCLAWEAIALPPLLVLSLGYGSRSLAVRLDHHATRGLGPISIACLHMDGC